MGWLTSQTTLIYSRDLKISLYCSVFPLTHMSTDHMFVCLESELLSPPTTKHSFPSEAVSQANCLAVSGIRIIRHHV